MLFLIIMILTVVISIGILFYYMVIKPITDSATTDSSGTESDFYDEIEAAVLKESAIDLATILDAFHKDSELRREALMAELERQQIRFKKNGKSYQVKGGKVIQAVRLMKSSAVRATREGLELELD